MNIYYFHPKVQAVQFHKEDPVATWDKNIVPYNVDGSATTNGAYGLVHYQSGTLDVHDTDWIVIDATGVAVPVSNAYFLATYTQNA